MFSGKIQNLLSVDCPTEQEWQGRSLMWEIPRRHHPPIWDNKISRADIQMSVPNSEQSFPFDIEDIRHVL